VLYSCLTFTHSHTDGGVNHARQKPTHPLEQLGNTSTLKRKRRRRRSNKEIKPATFQTTNSAIATHTRKDIGLLYTHTYKCNHTHVHTHTRAHAPTPSFMCHLQVLVMAVMVVGVRSFAWMNNSCSVTLSHSRFVNSEVQRLSE